jgi:hypothetical protein
VYTPVNYEGLPLFAMLTKQVNGSHRLDTTNVVKKGIASRNVKFSRNSKHRNVGMRERERE